MRVAAESGTGTVVNAYPPAGIAELSAETPTRPWAIYLTDSDRQYRLLCFDLDGKTPEAAEAAATDAAAIAQLLTDTGLSPVVCQSGPQGGRHIWVALREAVAPELVHRLADLAKALHPTLDLSPIKNAAAGCVRPPGAPHRNGGSSTVIDGDLRSLTHPAATAAHVSAVVERLAQLVNDLAITARAEGFSSDVERDGNRHDHIPGTKRDLSPAAAAAVRTNAAQEDASAVLWRALIGAAAAHWTYVDVARLAQTAPGFEHVRTKPSGGRRVRRTPAETTQVLRRQWARAVAYIASGRRVVGRDDTFDARADAIATSIQTVQDRADAAPGRWNRGGGPADRRVLDALCVFALTALSGAVEADTRRLALTVGIGRETARTALLRLADDGWITRTHQATGPNGARWEIRTAPVINSNPDTARSQVAHRPPGSGTAARNALIHELTTRIDNAAHDLFTPGALGIHAGNVYARCTHDPLPLGELAYRTGADAAQTVHTLTILTEAGVLHLTRNGWHQPLTDTRDAIAAARGVFGRLAARAERYAVEREMWAWWLDELEWMHTPRAQRAKRPGLGQLALVPDLGPAPRPIHPRTADGRADFTRARCHITGTEPPEPRPKPVPVTEAERLIIDVLGGTPIATLPLPQQEKPERTGIQVRGRDSQSKTGEGSRVRFIEIPPATA